MISSAFAQTAAGPLGGDLMGMLPIIFMFVLLYFLMIRPQMKRQKEAKAMMGSLQKGDEVIAAGMLGKITKVGETFIGLEIADNVIVQVQKQAVGTLLPKGTIKSTN
ncbi:MAG: preprotein translocase subunit YajC [Burkholderiales bacterium]